MTHIGLLLGIAFAFAALASFRSIRRWSRGAVQTSAVVVDKKTRLFSSLPTWNAVFEFTTREGKTIRVRSNTSSALSDPLVGERVPIRYDPSNPEDARIARASHLYALPTILTFVAVCSTFVWAGQRLYPGLGGGDPGAPAPIGAVELEGGLPTAVAVVPGSPSPDRNPDLAALRRRRTFSLSAEGLRAVAMDPGGNVAALALPADTLVIFDLAQGVRLGSAAPGGRIYSLGFSPDGAHVVAGLTGRVVRADVPSGHIGSSVEFGSASGGRTEVTDVAVSPSGEVAVATAGTDIVFVDLERGRPLGALRAGDLPLTRLAWSPDGRNLTSLGGREVAVWPTSDLAALSEGGAQCRLELPGRGTDLAYATDPSRVVVALAPEGDEGLGLLVVDLDACRSRHIETAATGVAIRIAVGAGGDLVLLPSADGRVRTVSLADGLEGEGASVDPGTAGGILLATLGHRLVGFSLREGRLTVLDRP